MQKNKLTVIIGPNGSGKSTLLKIITGYIKTDAKIENEFNNIFYLPQNPYYPFGITTFEYLSSVYFKNNMKWFLNKEEKQKIDDILGKISLYDKRDINIENLSGGELQKVNMALGLLSGADLFLLDEPVSNMDLINQIKILKMLRNLTKENITSIIIMHDMNMAVKYGDCFLGLGFDNKIMQKDDGGFFDVECLKQLFGMDFKIIKDEENSYVQVID